MIVDYNCSYSYVVENRLPGKIVVIHWPSYYGRTESDTVKPSEAKLVFYQNFMCSKNAHPGRQGFIMDSLEIYYNDTVRITKNLQTDSVWNFSSNKYNGAYRLIVDSALLKP